MTVEQIRTNLPQEPNSFIGREHELDELRRFLIVTRALTLCGPGGIGKTRLALRILAALADDYPDGVWLIELADLRQPDLVVSRLASVIGVDEERGRPLLETLADALKARRLLIALDNCEHLIDACARVCERLLASSPGLRLITTTREPLRVAAETVWQVQPLTVPPAGGVAVPAEPDRYEAIRLFADRAAASLPGFAISRDNAAAAAALCRALDGIPLAIELAAVWVRVLSVEQIAARLADRFGLLTIGDRTAPPRQRTLRAAIDWSHDLLTTREQKLLRRLSVFVGFSLEMAEQVCSDDSLQAADMLDLIAGLVDKSLVVLEPEVLGQARYRMLDTIREYAAARLADAAESAIFQRRLRDYTLGVVEHNVAIGMAQIQAPWSARVDVFRRYDVDAGNAWQVLSWSLAGGDAETGLRICTGIRPCWIVRGSFAEGAEWLDSFLALNVRDVPPGVLGPALVGRAQLALSSSDPAAARSWATEGLELCRAAGDEFWIAAALNVLSEVALHLGHLDEAASRAAEAQAVSRASGDGWNEGYALGTLAAIAGLQGRLRGAQQCADASISVMRRIDHQWGVARTLLGLGDLARLRGDPSDAHDNYLAALPILRGIDSRPEIARCLAGLGRVGLDQGEVGLARKHLAESLRLSHSTGARIGVARGLEGFAGLAVLEDRPERAVPLAAAAAALRKAAGIPQLSGARIERYKAPVRKLGEPAIGRLWAQGLAMTADAAVALALEPPPEPPPSEPWSEPSSDPRSEQRTEPPARTAAAEGGASPELGDPVTVNVAAAGSWGAVATPPGTLTPREREIVGLVAAGRSNRAIAEELFISPATAARHVANILAKLGFTSRTQIAAWAMDRGFRVGEGNGGDPTRPART